MRNMLCTTALAAIITAAVSTAAFAQYQSYGYAPAYPAQPAYGYAQPGYAANPYSGCGGWGQPACVNPNAAAGAVVGGVTGAAIGAAAGGGKGALIGGAAGAALGAAAGSTQPSYGYAPAYGSSYPQPAYAYPQPAYGGYYPR